MYTTVPGCHRARSLPASRTGSLELRSAAHVVSRFSASLFFGSPAETSDLNLQFIVLVFQTCDTLVCTCTPVDVVEGVAQVGGQWIGGGDGVGSGLDFDGAVAAGGADELPRIRRPAGG
jgi:hypothetical protein